MANSVVVAIGSNQLWAFTPAIDLLQHAVTPATGEAAAAAAAALTKSSAESTEAAATPASSSGKSSASSALARLLLKAAPSPAPAPAAPATPAGGTGSLSLLLVDSGDILSALKTAVRSHTHRPSGSVKDAPLQLYLLDAESSSTARHLLLLSIAFDTALSLRARTELFLEVYGNALIQEKTQRYINAKVKEIRKYMSSLQVLTPAPSTSNAATPAPPLGDQSLSASLFRHTVDLSHLKNRELDALEAALDFMTTPLSRPSLQKPEDTPPVIAGASVTLIEEGDESKDSDEAAPLAAASAAAASSTAAVASVPSVPRILPQKDGNAFDVETLRDHRLRGYFADRYDARVNLIDWDYHMRLKAVASIIHPVHYKKWRMTGVAFEERLCTYTYPNRSFASYRDAKSKTRGSVLVRGYWSDTLVSPYITLGVEANDRRLFNRKNHQHVKTSPHVCEYNLLSLLYELETGTPYALPKKKEDLEKATKQQKSKGKKTPAEEAKEKDEEEIVLLPDEVALPQESAASASAGSSSSAPLLASPVVQSSSGVASSSASNSAVSSSASHALNHTTPHALSLAHVRFVFLNGTAQALATKSRYAHAFDGAYLSQFQVGCINETAAARATQEAKQAQAGSGAPASASAAAAATSASSSAPAASDSLPLNQLLRPGARVTVETVKFLPVTAEVKDAYRSRVNDLAKSAGWVAASPAGSAWSEGYSHSWTDRTVEQPQEEADKEQALTQPAHLHFLLPTDNTAQKK